MAADGGWGRGAPSVTRLCRHRNGAALRKCQATRGLPASSPPHLQAQPLDGRPQFRAQLDARPGDIVAAAVSARQLDTYQADA